MATMTIDEQVKELMAPRLDEFADLYQKKTGAKADSTEMFWTFQETFGEWLAEHVCKVLGVDDGACIHYAMQFSAERIATRKASDAAK